MFKIIRTEEEFNAIKADWDRFTDNNSDSNVFLSHDWIASWIKYFLKGKKGRQLFIIAEYDDNEGTIKSIAPFYIDVFFLVFKCLRFISDDYSDYLGIAADNTGAIFNMLDEINSYLNVKRGGYKEIKEINKKEENGFRADMIYLKQVSEEQSGKILKYEKDKLHLTRKSGGDCYYALLPHTVEKYLEGFNSKQRYNILKRVKTAEKKAVQYISISIKNGDGNNIDYYLEEFFKLHQKRWNKKGKRGVFHNNKINAFFKSLFTALYNNGILNLSFLKYNDRLIAASACFDIKDKRQVYLPGFDPEYSFLQPGIVLTYYNIREAISLNCKEFDFLKGSEDYKRRFLAVKRANYKIYIYKTKIIYPIFKLNLFLKNEFFPKIKNIFICKYE